MSISLPSRTYLPLKNNLLKELKNFGITDISFHYDFETDQVIVNFKYVDANSVVKTDKVNIELSLCANMNEQLFICLHIKNKILAKMVEITSNPIVEDTQIESSKSINKIIYTLFPRYKFDFMDLQSVVPQNSKRDTELVNTVDYIREHASYFFDDPNTILTHSSLTINPTYNYSNLPNENIPCSGNITYDGTIIYAGNGTISYASGGTTTYEPTHISILENLKKENLELKAEITKLKHTISVLKGNTLSERNQKKDKLKRIILIPSLLT